jgi:hypothetical protein
MNGLPLFGWTPPPPKAPLRARFDGAFYRPDRDDEPLADQLTRIYDVVKDGQWRTVAEIAALTRDMATSVSAQLRNLRKPRHGGFRVESRIREGRLFEYRLLPPDPDAPRRERVSKAAQIIGELREENARLRERIAELERGK